MKRSRITDAILGRYYVEPVLQYLNQHAPWYFVFTELEITPFELKMMDGEEGKFVALLTVKVQNACHAIIEDLSAPTLPVHDEPMPPELLTKR